MTSAQGLGARGKDRHAETATGDTLAAGPRAGRGIVLVAGGRHIGVGVHRRLRAEGGVEPTAADTATFAGGASYPFDVQATLSSGRKVTLLRGTWYVLADYSV